MALAGAQRVFNLMDEKPEEDHGAVTLVNVSYDADGAQLQETEKRTNLWAWKVPHGVGMVMVPVREEEDGTLTELSEQVRGAEQHWAWKYSDGRRRPDAASDFGTGTQYSHGELLPHKTLRRRAL